MMMIVYSYMAEVSAKVKGKEVSFTFDYKSHSQAKEFIAEKTGVSPHQVSQIKPARL